MADITASCSLCFPGVTFVFLAHCGFKPGNPVDQDHEGTNTDLFSDLVVVVFLWKATSNVRVKPTFPFAKTL